MLAVGAATITIYPIFHRLFFLPGFGCSIGYRKNAFPKSFPQSNAAPIPSWRRFVGGCTECNHGIVLSACDDIEHAENEVEYCGTCQTIEGGDDGAALRLIRLAEWLAPAELRTFYFEVIKQADAISTIDSNADENHEGETTIIIEYDDKTF